MNIDLNKQIAQNFFVDSGDYLKRYQILKEHQTHIGNKSKLLIDILFSIECSLKALIFIESNVDEKETYQKIISHNLAKLVSLVNSEPLLELKEILKEDLDSISVSSRYSLEANIKFRNSIGVLDGYYYSTVGSPAWLDKIHFQANNLHNIVREKLSHISILKFEDIDVDKALANTRRYRELKLKKSSLEKSYSVEQIRQKHHKAYLPWTSNDDKKLESLFREGKTIEELCQVFERENGAIKSRINKLGLK